MAKQADDLASFDVETNVIDGDGAVITTDKVLDADHSVFTSIESLRGRLS